MLSKLIWEEVLKYWTTKLSIRWVPKWQEEWQKVSRNGKFSVDPQIKLFFDKTQETWLKESTHEKKSSWASAACMLIVCQHCDKLPNKLMWVLISVELRSRKVIVPLNFALFIPHLEYYVQFKVPDFKRDTDKLNLVPRRSGKCREHGLAEITEMTQKHGSCLHELEEL